MKKLIIGILFLMAVPALSWSGPFLVCDPQAGITHYRIVGLGPDMITSTAIADGSLRHDLASLSPGAYSIRVAACTAESGTVWEACSATTPFSFTKPSLSAPSTPAGVKLTK